MGKRRAGVGGREGRGAFVFEQVSEVIGKRPEKRSEKELRRVEPWFRKKSNLFSQLASGEV